MKKYLYYWLILLLIIAPASCFAVAWYVLGKPGDVVVAFCGGVLLGYLWIGPFIRWCLGWNRKQAKL